MRRSLKVSLLVFLLGGAAWAARDKFDTSIVEEAPLSHAILWRPNFEMALKEAKRTHRPLFVEFMASWCSDCRRLRDTTFSDPAVMTALNTTVPVRVDIDTEPEVAKRFSIDAIPALMFVDPETGTIVRAQRETVLPPNEFLAWFNGKTE